MTRYPVNNRDPSGMRPTEEASAKEIRKLYTQLAAELATESLNANTAQDLTKSTSEIEKKMITSMFNIVSKSEARAIRSTQSTLDALDLKITLGPTGLPKEQLDLLKMTVMSEVQSLTADTRKVVAQALSDGMNQGLGAKEMAKSILDSTDGNKSRAEMIARTTVMKTFTQTAKDRYVKAGAVGFYSIPAQDDRLCEKCRAYALNGNKLRFHEDIDLPLHPNCRCAIAPATSREDKYTL
jgi:SPP1 gp7 family putative phage head morphogenesis protein